jgi:hypothetical protein
MGGDRTLLNLSCTARMAHAPAFTSYSDKHYKMPFWEPGAEQVRPESFREDSRLRPVLGGRDYELVRSPFS